MMIRLMSKYDLKPGAYVKSEQNGIYGIVISLHEEGLLSYTYNVRTLNISKYWVFRKIQLWILKHSFK